MSKDHTDEKAVISVVPSACEQVRLWGKVAVALGYITDAQTEELFKLQQSKYKGVLIGEVAVAEGRITEEQLKEVLKTQTNDLIDAISQDVSILKGKQELKFNRAVFWGQGGQPKGQSKDVSPLEGANIAANVARVMVQLASGLAADKRASYLISI
jgi:hypothetical protein